MSDDLTRDNLPLSRPTKGGLNRLRAINCNNDISEQARQYVRESLAENTRIAYQSDLAHFECWGGQIPATPEMVANYLAASADSLSVATLTRRLAALSKVHRSRGLPNPTSTELVKSAVRGLRRIKSAGQRQARPLLKADLIATLEATGERLQDVRDRALLLVGFAGGFRRSELVGLNCEDIEIVRQGMIVTLRRSKTDQHGKGRNIGIPYARGRWCPVVALSAWKEAASLNEGALFRPVNRHQCVGLGRLSGEAVCLIVRARVKTAGQNPEGYSSHSLRAGFATSAAQEGVPGWKIRRQTGHASDAMLSRYIRLGELFVENALCSLL